MREKNEHVEQDNGLRKNFIQRLGGARLLVTKGLVTTLCANQFYQAFFQYAGSLGPLSDVASLSFDCDSEKDVKALPSLLKALETHGVTSSFACVGALIEQFPEEHQLIVDSGHEIINHTYSHPFNEERGIAQHFDALSQTQQKDEICRCQEVATALLGYQPVGFRIPHFAIQHSNKIYSILSDLGFLYSTSILATSAKTFGAPYFYNDIIEFPLSACPRHPFQAFDTYHAFRGRYSSHGESDFVRVLDALLHFNDEKKAYVNFYFDPQDFAGARNGFLDEVLTLITSSRRLKTYAEAVDIVRSAESDVSSYNDPLEKTWLVCSHGGHLAEMLSLLDAFPQKKHELALVTYDSPITKKLSETLGIRTHLLNSLMISKAQLITTRFDAIRFVADTLLLGLKEFSLLVRENPDTIVSTGSEIALPMFWAAKLLGKRTIFIESLCRVDSFSGTAKAVHPVADLLLTQWPDLAGKLEKAQYRGNILKGPSGTHRRLKDDMILVTVGTAPFDRLVKKMDELAAKIDRRVFMQIGASDYQPKNAEYADFVQPSEMMELVQKSGVIVSHTGVGSIINAIDAGVPFIAVPRIKSSHEINSDHQQELGSVLLSAGILSAIVTDVDELEMALGHVRPMTEESDIYARDSLVNFLTNYLQQLG